MQLILCSIILSLHFSPRFPSTLLNYLEPQYYTLSLKKSLPRTKDLVFLSFICEFEMLMASRSGIWLFTIDLRCLLLVLKKKLLFLIMEVILSHSSLFWVIWKIQGGSRGKKNFHSPKITTFNTWCIFFLFMHALCYVTGYSTYAVFYSIVLTSHYCMNIFQFYYIDFKTLILINNIWVYHYSLNYFYQQTNSGYFGCF